MPPCPLSPVVFWWPAASRVAVVREWVGETRFLCFLGLRSNNYCSPLRPGATGATNHNKQGAGSSPPLPFLPPHLPPPSPSLQPSSASAYCPPAPPTPLHPPEPRPLEAPGLRAGVPSLHSGGSDMEVEEDPEGPEPSTLPEVSALSVAQLRAGAALWVPLLRSDKSSQQGVEASIQGAA